MSDIDAALALANEMIENPETTAEEGVAKDVRRKLEDGKEYDRIPAAASDALSYFNLARGDARTENIETLEERVRALAN